MKVSEAIFIFFIYFFFKLSSIEEIIGFVEIFDFRFLIDLCVVGYPEHDLIISGKCLTGCLCVGMTKILWQVWLEN